MRVLSTLYVREHRAKVGLQKQALLVARGDGTKSRVPLNAIDAVVLLGSAQVTSDALAACVERQIRVSSLRRNGRIRFAVGGPTSGNVHLRLAQFDAHRDPRHALAISNSIVAGKLQNYRRLMQRWSWDAREPARGAIRRQFDLVEARLGALHSATDGHAVRGIEGDGTARYFKALRIRIADSNAPLAFSGRNRRPPRDPVNALLSFGYALSVAEVVGALESVGLDPQIGFFHVPRSGRPALALDLVEEFRATTDRFVVRVVARRQISDGEFIRTPGGACYLTEDGRRRFLQLYEEFRDEVVDHLLLARPIPRWSLATIQATLLARHLRGDLEMYPPYVMV